MRTYEEDQKRISLKMQPHANRIYNLIWPDCDIIQVDDDTDDLLKRVLDLAGIDIIIRHPNKAVFGLAQRIRTYEYSRYDDFTLRDDRPTYDSLNESEKYEFAFQNGALMPAYYAYGHANQDMTGFERFRVIDLPSFVYERILGNISEPEPILDRDSSATFKAWSFSDISPFMVIWEMR